MASTASPSKFPPVRACLFDMDGLLLDTEDLMTVYTNMILTKYNRPPVPWSIKAQLQGRPAPAAGEIFHTWAQLPISKEEYLAETVVLQAKLFPTSGTLPGVEELLKNMEEAGVHMALATSSNQRTFKLKTDHLGPWFQVFSKFDGKRKILGDDARLKKGRGKPAPDIYLLALRMVNETLPEGEKEIKPEECLVFEDSVPGVEAGRRAGMRVIWCPHPELFGEFKGREAQVLAGRADEEGLAELADTNEARDELWDGWAEHLVTLEDFPYSRYGIQVE